MKTIARKLAVSLGVGLLAAVGIFGQQVNLATQTKGLLPAANGGTGTTPGSSLPSTPCTNGKTFVKTNASPTSAAFYACIGTAWIQQGGSLGSLTGVIKASSGTPAVVSGSASDCVFVNGTSGTCGVPVAGTGILVVGSTVSIDPSAVNTAAGTNTNTGPLFDNTAVTHTLPVRTGTLASIPGTCTAGELYFASDQTAGANVYGCKPANTWTVQGSAAATASGPWWYAGQAFTYSTSMGQAANTPRYLRVVAPYPMSISKFNSYIAVADAGKYMGMAIYDSSCNRLTAATSTGQLLTTAIINFSVALGGGALTLSQGSVYYIAFGSDGTASQFATVNDGTGTSAFLSVTETGVSSAYFDGGNAISVAGGTITWPASCGARALKSANQIIGGVFLP